MTWIKPIMDRTIDDVKYAMENQNSTDDLKGAWNISDINRVINNTIDLNNRLKVYGFGSNLTQIDYFVESDLPYVSSKMNIIRDNVKNVIDSYYKLNHKPIIYGNIFDYNQANVLELNLYETNRLLESMIDKFKYSGMFSSGETINL